MEYYEPTLGGFPTNGNGKPSGPHILRFRVCFPELVLSRVFVGLLHYFIFMSKVNTFYMTVFSFILTLSQLYAYCGFSCTYAIDMYVCVLY